MVDKQQLYGENTRSHRLRESITRKAMDLPEDDMNVNVKHGWGWKEVAVAGVLALGAYGLATRQPVPAPVAPPAHEDRDTTRQITIEKFVPK